MTDDVAPSPQQEEASAIGRIALSSDGALLHRYLRRVLESTRVVNDYGALSRHEGARILARDLMAAMAKEIEAKSVRSGAEQPVLSASSGPVAVASTRTRRRVPDAEPGESGSGGSGTPAS